MPIINKTKKVIHKIPIINKLALWVYRWIVNLTFKSSSDYWEKRYARGGNSGPGSYNNLAKFKADILNQFVEEYKINSVIELGCGDGNQLLLSRYPNYLGFDVSEKAINLCKSKFRNDPTKSFKLIHELGDSKADLTLSLDVIFHLVEDDIFEEHLYQLIHATNKFVIIYSSNSNEFQDEGEIAFIKHRKFTDWIDKKFPMMKLQKIIRNKYPFNGDSHESSFSDFYIYIKPD